MKMSNKIIYIVALCMLLLSQLMLPAFAETGEFTLPGPGPECFEYELSSDGFATITAYSGSTNAVCIPDMLDGHTVTAIADGVFSDHTELRRIDFGTTLKSIGASAFEGCSSIEQIILPNTVVDIGERAFSACSSLYHADVGANVASLGKSAFEGCTSLADISLPETLNTVGENAFAACNALQVVTLASKTARIPENTFKNCANVTLYAPFGSAALEYAVANCEVVAAAGAEALTIGSALGGVSITAFNGNAKALIIPANINSRPVSAIAADALSEHPTLEAVVLPDTLRTIDSSAFSGDSSLRYVRMPRTLTGGIPTDCFKNCSSLKSIYLPEGIETISPNAFGNCASLSTVTFPETLKRIQIGAFYGASSLKSLIFKGAEPECTFTNSTPEVVCFGSAPNDMKIYVEDAHGWPSMWYPNGRAGFVGYPVTARSTDCFYVEYINVFASCAHEGSSTFTCRFCGDSHNKTYAVKPHNFVSMGKGDSVETFRCTGCTANYTVGLIEAASIAITTDISGIGEEIIDTVTVTFRGQTLTEGVDYTCEKQYIKQYSRIMVTITGIGDYSGTQTQGYSALTGNLLKRYTLTVIGASGSGSYFRDDAVTMIPDTPTPEGMEAVWSIDDGKFSYTSNEKARIDMPAHNVTVTLTYVKAPETQPPETQPPETQPPVTEPPVTQPPETTDKVTTDEVTTDEVTTDEVTTRPPYSQTDTGKKYITQAMVWAFLLIGSLAVFAALIIITFKSGKKK